MNEPHGPFLFLLSETSHNCYDIRSTMSIMPELVKKIMRPLIPSLRCGPQMAALYSIAGGGHPTGIPNVPMIQGLPDMGLLEGHTDGAAHGTRVLNNLVEDLRGNCRLMMNLFRQIAITSRNCIIFCLIQSFFIIWTASLV